MRLYDRVTLIWISQIISNWENICIWLLIAQISSSKNCLLMSLDHLSIGEYLLLINLTQFPMYVRSDTFNRETCCKDFPSTSCFFLLLILATLVVSMQKFLYNQNYPFYFLWTSVSLQSWTLLLFIDLTGNFCHVLLTFANNVTCYVCTHFKHKLVHGMRFGLYLVPPRVFSNFQNSFCWRARSYPIVQIFRFIKY